MNCVTERFPKSGECRCFSDRDHMALVAKCTVVNELPPSLPDDLDWLILSGNNITELVDTNNTLLTGLSKLDLNSNSIKIISSEFLEQFSQLSSLDISNNKLNSLPKILENLTKLEEVWISGNDFECNYGNIWMSYWAENQTDFIQDLEETKCQMEYDSWIR